MCLVLILYKIILKMHAMTTDYDLNHTESFTHKKIIIKKNLRRESLYKFPSVILVKPLFLLDCIFRLI